MLLFRRLLGALFALIMTTRNMATSKGKRLRSFWEQEAGRPLAQCGNTMSSEVQSVSPRDKSGAVLQFQNWTLSAFIDAAHDIGLLGLDVKKHGHALRDFRNFTHPYEHMRANFTADTRTAKIGLQVLLAAIADLRGRRGKQT
jgi:hypothetical protein